MRASRAQAWARKNTGEAEIRAFLFRDRPVKVYLHGNIYFYSMRVPLRVDRARL